MCIESLVVRGAMLMARFLQGEPSDSFAWLNPSGYIGSAKQLGRLSGGLSPTAFYDDEGEPAKKPVRSAWKTIATTTTVAVVLGGAGWYFMKDEHKEAVKTWVSDFSRCIRSHVFKKLKF